jgi:hypothetical protein
MALGMRLLKVPRGRRFLMSEVPLCWKPVESHGHEAAASIGVASSEATAPSQDPTVAYA